MFRSVIAAFLLTAPTAAALGQVDSGVARMSAAQPGEGPAWSLATMPNGCMVQAVSPQGTMLSVWGFAGEEKLGFLLQNPEWTVRDGQSYALEVEFLGARSWPVEATARQEIDADGPGLYFTLQPGSASSKGFLASFTTAEGMRVQPDGVEADTLPLAGSRGAMSSLARCLSERWSRAASQGAAEESEEKVALATS
ncbi:MAG TPA: hypothetical protein VGB59_00370 [Allosphingosinicella sp.]|jgi:hypothetical protein